MQTVNIYLNFTGTTEEVFNFYKSIFGGEFTMLQRFNETPEKDKLSEAEGKKIMHIALPVGKNVLMGSDALESMGHSLTMGNNFTISLNADSKEEADKIFTGLSAGGKVDMAMQDMFWGAYFGMLKDKYGVQWMVSFDKNSVK